MTNIAKQISEWDIETIKKRLIEIQGAADGDCHFSHGNGNEVLAIAQRAIKLAKLSKKVFKSINVNDIVQITDPKHHWFSCLIVVDKIANWGCIGYIEVPRNGKAYVRLEHNEFKIVGQVLIIDEDK